MQGVTPHRKWSTCAPATAHGHPCRGVTISGNLEAISRQSRGMSSQSAVMTRLLGGKAVAISGIQWHSVAFAFMYTSSESMASVIVSYSAQPLTSSRLTNPSTCPSAASRATVRLMSRMRFHWRYRQKATKKKPRSEGQSYLPPDALRRTQTHSDALRRTDAQSGTIQSLIPIGLVIRHNPIARTNWTCHQAQSNRSYQLDLSAQYERRPSLRIAWSSYAMKKVTNPSRQLSTRRSLGSPLASSESYLLGERGNPWSSEVIRGHQRPLGSPLASSESYHSRLRGRMVAWGVIRPDSSRSKRRRT